MVSLTAFPLPLPQNGPPAGFCWEERDLSALSTTTAFNTRIDARDVFLGEERCVICGVRSPIRHCHISKDLETDTWQDLRKRGWIPVKAKEFPSHEPRNGIRMCKNHRALFDSYQFFIRFVPAIRKFVCVNYSGNLDMQPYHGKAIALDIKDRYAPFPSLFIIHEVRVRGFHPSQPVSHTILDDVPWQDWILSPGVLNNTSDSYFNRGASLNRGNSYDASRTRAVAARVSLTQHDGSLPDGGSSGTSDQPQLPFQPTITGGASSGGGMILAPDSDVWAEIVAATRAMPSWRACQMENTSWTGTAEENIKKYVSTIDTQDPQSP